MSYFRTCEYCGGNLDPGEKCDCRERKNKKKEVAPCITRSTPMIQYGMKRGTTH